MNPAQTFLAAGVTTALHPLAYVKTLIQVGYEPLVPVPSTTIFGSKVLMYPNVFKYLGHIKRTEGFFGLYRGLAPRLLSNIVCSVVSNTVSAELVGQPVGAVVSVGQDPNNREKVEPKYGFAKLLQDIVVNLKRNDRVSSYVCDLANSRQTEGQVTSRGRFKTTYESLARCAGTVASQPLYVIAVRSMCQIVGQETKYSSITSAVTEIYHNEGILGFFSGLLPRLIGELLTIWLANVLTHVIDNVVLSSDELNLKDKRTYSSTLSQLVVSQMTYPFLVVSSVMSISDSGLLAASLPPAAKYGSWIDCWSHLSRAGQLKRGSGMFWRVYKGPSRIGYDGNLAAAIEPF